MALFTIEGLDSRVAVEKGDSMRRWAGLNLKIKMYEALASEQAFQIFLSHSYSDASHIELLYEQFQDLGYSVYVDWKTDLELDRANVTNKTAETIRARMSKCSALIYVYTDGSRESVWMPWELGYFDGLNGKVAILPIVPQSKVATYVGQEYLGVYPYVDQEEERRGNGPFFWVNWPGREAMRLSEWLKASTAAHHSS